MKSMIVLFALFALTAAQTGQPIHHDEHRSVLQTLIKRGELLIENTLHELKQHRDSRAHILQALDHQIVGVEAFVKELKALHDNPLQHIGLHHLHTIEESLLYMENRISEELVAVHETMDHKREGDATVEKLVERAEKLISTANKTIKDHEGHNHHQKEIAAIKDEVQVVESLVHKVRSGTTQHLEDAEESLARHEKTLHQLIERVDSHHV